MSTPVSPTTQVRPTRPPKRRKKGRGIGIFVFIAVWIGFGIYSATRNSHHHYSSAHDRSDLIVVPASVTVPAGGPGIVALRLENSGPDDLDHNVTFTIAAGAGLTITGSGSIDEGGEFPYDPKDGCTLNPRGTGMSCQWFVEIDQGRHDSWRIPVRVAPGVAPGTALSLDVKAVGNSLYTDPDTANNTHIGYSVHVSKRGSRPVTPRPSRPSSPTAAPTRPSRTSSPSSTSPPTSHPSAGKRIRNAARDAVLPVTIVAAAVLGLALLIVISLIFVARRQRRLPLNYIPPRRDSRS